MVSMRDDKRKREARDLQIIWYFWEGVGERKGKVGSRSFPDRTHQWEWTRRGKQRQEARGVWVKWKHTNDVKTLNEN